MRRRTQSRRLALQWLYRCDLCRDESDDGLGGFLGLRGDPPEVRKRAREIVEGVRRSRAAIDREISKVAENWTLDRMATIDRNVLRLAAWELACTDTPPAVVLNEAVELAKTFSTEHSGGFVNGILDRMRPDRERLRDAFACPAGSGG
jgi:N utilization substance protein B